MGCGGGGVVGMLGCGSGGIGMVPLTQRGSVMVDLEEGRYLRFFLYLCVYACWFLWW